MSTRGLLLGIAAGVLFSIAVGAAGFAVALLAFVAGVTACAALLYWLTDDDEFLEGLGPSDEDEDA